MTNALRFFPFSSGYASAMAVCHLGSHERRAGWSRLDCSPYHSSPLSQLSSSQVSSTLFVPDHIAQPSVVASTSRPALPLGSVTTSHSKDGLSWVSGARLHEPSSHIATCPWANCSRVLRIWSG